ncbi:amidohydrolase [Frankia sp. CcI49]|uniref:Predicted metal-dependent hydrolase, TIM-barrel fold n=1 Tax=Parafrankia irregularis TaxID=795642 RepID=A0A0S4QJM6_9ACTN|nr:MULTISPECIES: amidohydrolase family protein [Frankiaceae]MBE3204108.1 amidohydrolase [Parafrankia sp. CH37]ONH59302.1 amidohydrolase [Frankia sp. CcI49]CUU55016.1 Predicted metal-dependent hydrolase, TIM-barrel fold [Parafrankia irregularis]
MSIDAAQTRPDPGYQLIDADNHYYEPYDCFTRFIEPSFADRAINVRVDARGRGKLYFGERQFRFMRVIQTDYIGAPGSLRSMLDDPDSKEGFVHHEVIRGWDYPDMMLRDARIAKMDEQGVQAGLMLGTAMLQAENELHDDIPALYANIRAYNRWLDEEWGFDRDNRIITAPMISLMDPERAITELDKVIAAGARAVVMKPGPLWGRSPVDPSYDGFWARLQDAGVKLVFHSTDPRYLATLGVQFGESPTPPLQGQTPFQWYLVSGKPVADTLASYVLNNLFGRFPGLTIVALECGINWVVPLLHDVDHAAHMGRKGFWPGGEVTGRPSEVLMEHLYVSPFYEEDVVGLVEAIGPDRVLFGSDYPHPEGVLWPTEWLNKLDGLSPEAIRMILRGNAARLLGLQD